MDELVVIGHRGNPETFPENTLASYSSAFDCGASAVELDVHVAACGTPVVFHDDNLFRITGEFTRIKDTDYSFIKERTEEYFSNQGFEGVYAPTLGEALDTIFENGKDVKSFKVVIEIKKGEEYYPGIVQLVAGELKKRGIERSCVVSSFDLNTINIFTKKYPDVKRGFLPRIYETNYLVKICQTLQLHSLHLPASEEGMKAGKKLAEDGVDVYFYTVNDSGTLSRSIESGARGVFTDRPCFVKKVLKNIR